MKSQNFSRFFHPLYLLIASVFGAGILLAMFSPFLPLECPDGAVTFLCVPGFSVVFALMAILWCMLTIFFIPGYAMLIWLFKQHTTGKGRDQRLHQTVQLFVIFLIIATISYMAAQLLYQLSPDAQRYWDTSIPKGVQLIIDINTVGLFLVLLPYMLGMALVHSIVREIGLKMQDTSQLKTDQAFRIINDLQTYRKMLQTLLNISGGLLSMMPLIMVSMRSVLITMDPDFAEIYPVTYVIFAGLVFTLLLLFIYAPTYVELSTVGQQLRDVLHPLNSLSDLKDTLDKRRIVDDLLQTQVSLMANLKSGILTLSPLVSSLLVLLGLNT